MTVQLPANITQAERILVSLHELGPRELDAEDVVVASWKKFPNVFGLGKYFLTHPDSNKVLATLMGDRGLVKRGFLARTNRKTYKLTHEGKTVAATLLGLNKPKIKYVDIPTTDQIEILRQEKSTAFQLYTEGNKARLESSMAWEFWAMPASAKGKMVDDILAWIERFYREMESLLDGSLGKMADGRLVKAEEVRVLSHLHEYLKEKFSVHITLLKCRK